MKMMTVTSDDAIFSIDIIEQARLNAGNCSTLTINEPIRETASVIVPDTASSIIAHCDGDGLYDPNIETLVFTSIVYLSMSTIA